ncbi:pentatricopeptide repeat-containing protein At2g21090 [Nymphaea colorata]|uniref:pentatricopeptide repeat-containing protein At2g21090 n=1 Tax=Nymphaea colorata TaxID=210225 RepID=UPI00129D48F6|nr:pentatricopeptide repeat-containing protein At2g21090 [Nymphaea colorata]XP_031495804.1 pentatricopeptide repeat-containing protein At2g21090 [Nymphaea colorata]XP_031495806.1 pentatricopeptide repeat-containing protein At2g21090 [Nymphaea colorata]
MLGLNLAPRPLRSHPMASLCRRCASASLLLQIGRLSPCFLAAKRSSSSSNAKRRVAGSCMARAIARLCCEGKLDEAVDSLDLLAERGLRLDSHTLAFLLQTCARSADLSRGRWVHLHILRTGTSLTLFVANHLLHLYARCGRPGDARKVFDKMPVKNVFSWNAMLGGYARAGLVGPARRLFDEMPERDVVSWNTMVVALAHGGSCEDAVKLFVEMQRARVGVNQFSFAGVLIACVSLLVVSIVRQVHAQVVRAGFMHNTVTASSLVDGYAKCEEINDARQLFDEIHLRDVTCWTSMISGYAKSEKVEEARRLFELMPERNEFSWNAIIMAYAQNGLGLEALEVLRKMVSLGLRPNQFTYSGTLRACSSISGLKHGKEIHAHLLKAVFRPNIVVVSCLIDMYSQCGYLEYGQRIFHGLRKMDIVACNTMVSAFAHHGCGKEAIKLFEEMLKEGMKPDSVTLLAIVMACAHAGLIEEGIRYFRLISDCHGVNPQLVHYVCLIDLLLRAGCFSEATGQHGDMASKTDVRITSTHTKSEWKNELAEQLVKSEPYFSAGYDLFSSMYVTDASWGSLQKVKSLMKERQSLSTSWIQVDNKMHGFVAADHLQPLEEDVSLILMHLASHMMQDE